MGVIYQDVSVDELHVNRQGDSFLVSFVGLATIATTAMVFRCSLALMTKPSYKGVN